MAPRPGGRYGVDGNGGALWKLNDAAEPGNTFRRHRCDTTEGHVHGQPGDHSRPGEQDTSEETLGDEGMARMPLRVQGTAACGYERPQLDRAVLPGRGGRA